MPTPPAVPGATGPPPPPSAVVTLDGLNDVDGPMTAVLVTSEWGSASLADELPSGVVEVLSDGTKITGVRSGSAITVPEPGSVGLVLSAAARNSIPWLAIGDPLVVHTDLAAPTGPAATAIGGNARLVAAGVVDPSCSLEGDTSRRPRVAVGLYDSNRTLLLVVSDGDAPSEPGLTLGELASLVRALGADDALNLDGGQSSTLTEHINGSWDEVNNGSGDRWVANVLALVPA